MSSRWRGGAKPRDAGTGVVCASFGRRGEWLSFGAPHPRHGFVELSGAPAFAEVVRGQPQAVRRYRALLAEEASAFLLVEQPPECPCPAYGLRARLGEASIAQELRLRTAGSEAEGTGRAIRLRFRGRLDRPPLAMITEIGAPPTATGARTLLEARGATLRVSAPELPAVVEIRLEGGLGEPAWSVRAGEAALLVTPPAEADEAPLRVVCELVEPRPPRAGRGTGHRGRLGHGHADDIAGELVVPANLRRDLQRMRARALRYVRECTALRSAAGRLAILTDHRLLPLSWTRDGYYQAQLLLSDGQTDAVAGHLRWLWFSCERPDHNWARSHHANGARKDEVFQADQQLYPLLELADYWRATGGLPALDGPNAGGHDWASLTSEAIDALVGRLSPAGLLPTDENAADDPAGMPFLLANQILAWYTFERLAELAAEVPAAAGLGQLAERLRAETAIRFAVDGPDGPLWSYAIDDRGSSIVYHDANDLPTTLAPLWGFCAADDPLWRRTMDFCFSPANEVYTAGPYGGLGSSHTPGTWPLGLIQEWLARSLAGRHEEAEDALRRLVACAMSDGSLPEASDPLTGQCLARPWFAWPGALLGTLVGAADRLHSTATAERQRR